MPAEQRKKIYIMIMDAGGGHRATANSLKAAVDGLGLPWDLRIVNVYKEIWHEIDLARRLFGVAGEDIYNFVLRHDLLFCTRFLRQSARFFIHLHRQQALALTRRFLAREKPDLILSIMPFVNDVYAQACRAHSVRLGLLLSDLVDVKPYTWFTPHASRQAHFVGVGCLKAAHQAKALGAGDRSLVCGLLIHPRYFDPALRALNKDQARRHLGLHPQRFTVLLMMGGFGSRLMASLVKQFEASHQHWQIVACCGKNPGLLAQLKTLAPRLKNRLLPLGFTSDLPSYMKAADLMVAKPGPASIMEAVAMRLPLVLDSWQVMLQEKPNVEFVQEHGLGLSVSRRSHIFPTVQTLADNPQQLNRIRSRMAQFPLQNSALSLIRAMQKALSSPAPQPAPAALPQAPSLFSLLSNTPQTQAHAANPTPTH